MIKLRLAKKEDLKPLAKIYKDLYCSSILNENWTEETAYIYTLQSDIFIVAEENEKVVGAVTSLVKPWHDGNRLIETEIFVAKNYQHKGIGSKLFHEHFKKSIEKYDAKKAIINEFDWAEEAGYTLVNPDFQALYIANADVTIADSDGNIISSYKF